MNPRTAKLISGLVSVVAGLYLLVEGMGGDGLLDPLMTGIGLYFVGHGGWLASDSRTVVLADDLGDQSPGAVGRPELSEEMQGGVSVREPGGL